MPRTLRRLLPAVLGLAIACTASGVPAAEPVSHLDDLREWHRLGLPAAGHWNVVGYRDWQLKQVQAGHRFIPSVQLLPYSPQSNANPRPTARILSGFGDWKYMRDNGLPITIRTDNIVDVFHDDRWRSVPKFADSPVVWRLVPEGVKATPLADPFGPVSNWESEGKLWAGSNFMKQLQALHPNPAYVLFVENNEGSYDGPGRYRTAGRNGEWLPAAELGGQGLRMRDYLASPGAAKTPAEFMPEYYALRAGQWKGLYGAFDAALGDGWRGKLLTEAYSALSKVPGPSEADSYDAAGMQLYIANVKESSHFTSLLMADPLGYRPVWKAQREKNPKSYRQASIFLGGAAALSGAQAGLHEPITPARWEAYTHYALWAMHEPSVPVMLRYWVRAAAAPTDLMFEARQEAIDKLGIGELKTVTQADYATASMRAIDAVCEHPVLREAWLRGTPVAIPDEQKLDLLLNCSANTPRSEWHDRHGHFNFSTMIKVWCLAIRWDDKLLLFTWSPCKLTDPVTVSVPGVGDVKIDPPAPLGYWLIEGTGPAKRLPIEVK